MKGAIQSQILKKTTKILAGQKVEVYTEGFAPRVEYNPVTKQAERVFIPEIPDNASDQLVKAVHGYIDHEVGHILESSNEDICDASKSKLWHYLHNCIEDPRINAVQSDRFPGVEGNIRAGYNFMFEREDPVTKTNAYSKEHVDKIDLTDEKAVKDAQVDYSSVWFAKKANCRFHGPKYDDLDLDRLFAPLEAKMNPRFLDALSRARTTEEVKQASDYFEGFFEKEFKDPPPSGGKSKPGEKGKPDRLSDPKKLEDKLAEAIKTEIEHLAKAGKKNFYFSDRFDKTFTKYDIIKGHPMPDIAAFETETKTVTNYLAKDLRRMLEARNRRWYTGGYKSGKLNQKVLYSVRTGNDRIFSKKSEVRDVKAAVSLLIDLSGSMKGPRGDTKVHMAVQSAYAFAMVLEQLKVPYEIWGFCTAPQSLEKTEAWNEFAKTIDPSLVAKCINPYCPDDYFAFKTFESHFDIHAKQALVLAAEGKVRMYNNEDSAHVKKTLERLASRPEDQRTLFVFSDGMSQFAPGDNRPSHEMLKYLDKTAKEIYGTDIIAMGIQSADVSHYYKRNKVVTKLAELPAALFEFLKTRI
jgi:cobalamin biosynthesis protein CobT